jgi:ferredoxin-NADP reductase
MPKTKKTTKLKLLSSHDEAGNVRTFVFETGGLKWIAGQYQGYILPQAGKTEREYERWFTIASAPGEKEIHISTRVTESAFKQSLNALKPGEQIQAHTLGGDFTWEDEPSKPVVLIAGGIGVTPFRSMLIERAAKGKHLNATLLYFNRTDDIAFRKEFDSLAARHPEFSFVPIIGESITSEAILKRTTGSKTAAKFYLSGPEPMVEKIGNELKKEAIELKQDWFPGYDEKDY